MNEKIKWGILSTGKIAHKFAEDLVRTDNSILHAVGSRDLDKAKDFGNRFGASHAFGSYNELASFEDIDVIYIGSPHTFHFEHSLLCLNNGKHVLCEKPIGMNQDQVRTMFQTAQKNDRFLMEAMWTRFFPFFESLLTIINSGEIGQLKYIEADFGFNFPYQANHRLFDRNLGGGALLDVGIYPVFLATYLLGKPDDISAFMIPTKSGVDETISVQMKWKDQCMASLNASVAMDTRCEAKIVGTKKSIHIPRRWHEADRIFLMDGLQIAKELAFSRTTRGYTYEIMEVNQCIYERKISSEKYPSNVSLLVTEILDEVRKQTGIVYSSDS